MERLARVSDPNQHSISLQVPAVRPVIVCWPRCCDSLRLLATIYQIRIQKVDDDEASANVSNKMLPFVAFIFFFIFCYNKCSAGMCYTEWRFKHVSSSAPWASYKIRKIMGCACARNAGGRLPLQRKLWVKWSWHASQYMCDCYLTHVWPMYCDVDIICFNAMARRSKWHQHELKSIVLIRVSHAK